MSSTIIEALKKKGSSGGNNIMEAIENLTTSDSGGGVSGFKKIDFEQTTEYIQTLFVSYNQLSALIDCGITPYIMVSDDGGVSDFTKTTHVAPLCDLHTWLDPVSNKVYIVEFKSIDRRYGGSFEADSPDEFMVYDNKPQE